MRADLTEAKAMVTWAIRRWQTTMTPEELTEAIFDAPAMRTILEASLQSGSAGEVVAYLHTTEWGDRQVSFAPARNPQWRDTPLFSTPAKAAGGWQWRWRVNELGHAWAPWTNGMPSERDKHQGDIGLILIEVRPSPSPDGERQEGDE